MTIDATCVGQRMIVRYVVSGQGSSGGPLLTDVIGRVLAVGDGRARVERRDGTVVDIVLADVVVAKVVPLSPVRSRRALSISDDNLTRITSLGWPAVVSEPLGEWELRAANGFTGRANSVAVHGDPGMPGSEAIAAVKEFYAVHDLPPLAQVVNGSAGERLFAGAGWTPVEGRPAGAIVQVADLTDSPGRSSPSLGSSAPGSSLSVGDATISGHASDEWLALYNRVDDPATARAVLEGPATVGFVSIGEPLVAIGRVVVTGEWAGLACVEVAVGVRRQGLATRIVDASIAWARQHGADKAYLQTMTGNAPAIALYEPYGFQTHHTYVYLAPRD
ncbi:GNAT family N-acetyltransferase [Aeromicrobium sp.]